MSHASCIVALSHSQIAEHGSLEEAVAWNMEPFDENGEWFADGSRWDWYVIGGRYTGKFEPDYDPEQDPANIETCDLCGGTGKRADVVLALQGGPLPPFAQGGNCPIIGQDRGGPWQRKQLEEYLRETGCNGCQGTGKSVKWPSQWTNRGNITRRGDIDHLADKLTAYAFLKDRVWHERERLGWFACPTKTECEMKAEQRGETYEGLCVHACANTGAKIVSWSEADEGRWDALFWARFIRNLPRDTMLACVDYHV